VSPSPPELPVADTDISSVVAENLRRVRDERGLSLARLAEVTGVSRAMLHQIERGKSTPTISVVWKIATALGLPFSALLARESASSVEVLRFDQSWQLRSRDGKFASRALFPLGGTRSAEFYELRLEPGAVEESEPHRPGTSENIAVNAGSLAVVVGDAEHVLEAGDAILFTADLPHRYEARGDETVVAYLVMTYASRPPE